MYANLSLTVKRGGITSDYRTEQANPSGSLLSLAGGLEISFHLDSKGGGVTAVSVHVGASEFEKIAEAMMRADTNGALGAFALAILATTGRTDDGTRF